MQNTVKNQTVSVEVVSKLTGKSIQTVRVCIQKGLLPGICFKNPKSNKYNYIILKKDIEEFFGIKFEEGNIFDDNK